MKKIILLFLSLSISLTSFSTIWSITNSGTTFANNNISIIQGDSVNFILASMHNAIEVSKTTWDANGNTPLANGFQVPFGGGFLLPVQLTVGTHYYVCSPHASLGMKGIITVQAETGINEVNSSNRIIIFPEVSSDFITLKGNVNTENSKYIIYDLLGRIIKAGNYSNVNNVISVSELPVGIYFIQIGKPGQNVISRFLKN
jgi:plastocyanin